MSNSVSLKDVQAARGVVADLIRTTPVLESLRLGRVAGGSVSIKAESLQRAGSFKLRGVLNKSASLGPEARVVVTGSAGNHGQSLANIDAGVLADVARRMETENAERGYSTTEPDRVSRRPG